jgi:hypothetical protein
MLIAPSAASICNPPPGALDKPAVHCVSRYEVRADVTHHAANLLRARLVQPLVTLLYAHLRKLSAHGGKFTLNVDGWQIGDEEHGRNRVTAD